MNQTLITNISIVIAIVIGFFVTDNPLLIMALLLLQQAPPESISPEMLAALQEADVDSEGNPIGFVWSDQ